MLLAVAELAVVLLAVAELAVVLLVVVLVAVELVPHSVVVVVGVVVAEHFLAVAQSLAVVAAAQAETGLHWVTDWEHQRAGIDQPWPILLIISGTNNKINVKLS